MLVTISQVEVRLADGDPVELLEVPVEVDLLDLQGGVTMALGVAELPAGVIHQIRLIVESAEIVIDGKAFPLSIPSGEQSGIKLSRPGGFLIGPSATTTVIADFDAAESVHETGHGYQLRPVVRLVDVIFLQVTSPQPGGFVGTETVDVEGVFEAASPITSITVNGIPAAVFSDTFIATGIPVNPHGVTTLSVVATDADGFTAVLALVLGKAAGLMPEAKLSVVDPVGEAAPRQRGRRLGEPRNSSGRHLASG